MKQRFKVQKLLSNSLPEVDFLDSLTIHNDERKQLLEYRAKVRNCLRKGFQNLKKQEGMKLPAEIVSMLAPKFWTQGSFSYNTLNEPAHIPPQQIDLDDGVYFPMKLVNGEPVAAKNALLDLIRTMLEELESKEKGWKLSIKPTCARLEINDRIHIDIPVYAIPEERYISMAEAALSANQNYMRALDSDHFLLNPDEVYLAKWNDEEHWIQSDPRELDRWFKKECAIHGERLRRVCRYLKAWRDYNWPQKGPSSISLMVATAQVFDEYLEEKVEPFKTDCQALLEVAKKLPHIFSHEIMNPVLDDSSIFPNGLDEHEVSQIRSDIDKFSSNIEMALCQAVDRTTVISSLQKVLGTRLPTKPDWVEHLSVTEVVRNAPAQIQERPRPSESHRSA